MGIFDIFKKKDKISRDEILELILFYDNLRTDLMEQAILRGNKMAMMSAIMLHQVACPVFYAWEQNEHGKITDYWKEDLAIEKYKEFKKDVQANLKKDLTLYQNGLFPLKTLDKDGYLQEKMIMLIKSLIN